MEKLEYYYNEAVCHNCGRRISQRILFGLKEILMDYNIDESGLGIARKLTNCCSSPKWSYVPLVESDYVEVEDKYDV